MIYPIITIETPDNNVLQGLLVKTKPSKKLLIAIHGTASNFYENEFMEDICLELNKCNTHVLSANNRGADVFKAYPPAGDALELFEDCVIDIDSWIEWALAKGYTEIYLQGHSLGSEKVVYYMEHGEHTQHVASVILLSFSDSYGTQLKHLKEQGISRDDLLNDAKRCVQKGKPKEILRDYCMEEDNALLKTAQSYLSFFDHNSELSKALPLRNGKELQLYKKIQAPILAVIGDSEEDEYTIIPIKEALDLLQRENPNAECHQIAGANHIFEDKEGEVAQIVGSFLNQK